jgi:hypothetical protein
MVLRIVPAPKLGMINFDFIWAPLSPLLKELSMKEISELAIAADENYSTADGREARTDILQIPLQSLTRLVSTSKFQNIPAY